MKIYIDCDDVICETARNYTKLAKQLFGIELPYSKVQFFNLQKAFSLNDEQYEELLRVAHLPEELLIYEETPGAVEVINKWIDKGHEVAIITGRPFSVYEPTRKWLDNHGLERAELFCVDKYGRENERDYFVYSMTIEDLYNMKFDFAIEDSPVAFEHLMHFEECRVAVFDRPWNAGAKFPNDNYKRCYDWQEIDEMLMNLS